MDSPARSIFCAGCGQSLRREANFCPNCGTRIRSSQSVPSSQMTRGSTHEAILVARARCTATKLPFGIRFEQSAKGVWWACAAFLISERQVFNSAFSSNRIISSEVSPTYPGCPHCGTDSRKQFAGISFVRCSCGEFAYSTGIIGAETLCPWCDRAGILVKHGPLPVLGIRDR
jgi:hypothetical protein